MLTTGHSPLVASVGTSFVIAELASLEALSRASPDLAAFRDAAERFPGTGSRFSLHLYVRVDGDATRLRAHMFGPLVGVLEDPATGSANAALAALLTSLAPGENVDLTYDIEQGVEMGRPSRIVATARKTAEGPVTATVAGSCVPVLQGDGGVVGALPPSPAGLLPRGRDFLFDGHRFGQVAGLIDIGALEGRHLISQQLDRNGVENRRHNRIDRRKHDGFRSDRRQLRRPRRIAEHDDLRRRGPRPLEGWTQSSRTADRTGPLPALAPHRRSARSARASFLPPRSPRRGCS